MTSVLHPHKKSNPTTTRSRTTTTTNHYDDSHRNAQTKKGTINMINKTYVRLKKDDAKSQTSRASSVDSKIRSLSKPDARTSLKRTCRTQPATTTPTDGILRVCSENALRSSTRQRRRRTNTNTRRPNEAVHDVRTQRRHQPT